MRNYKVKIYQNLRKIRSIDIELYSNYLNNNAVLLKYWDHINWGDCVNPFLIEKIIDKPVVPASKVYNFLNKERLLGIGSMISGDLSNTVVWGTGYIGADKKYSPPKKVLAVRGKLTAKKLRSDNIAVPEIYGDPALLFPDYFNIKIEKKFRYGIIPHYTEFDMPILKTLKKKFGEEVNIIDIKSGVKNFAEEVVSCENIFSSSLHGLILAEAYNIPTCRIQISNNLIGGDFKFDDYYSGVGINQHSKLMVSQLVETNKLEEYVSQKDLNFKKDLLINSLKEYINNRSI